MLKHGEIFLQWNIFQKKIWGEQDCRNLIRLEKKACPDMLIPLFRV